MQNLESAAANYAAQQQAMGFPNMGTEDPYAGQQFAGQENAGAWQQWQQEYAQWQAQYGDQYEQAMQGMQMHPTSLDPNAHPPPPPPEDSGQQQGNFRGGRGGRGTFRGSPRAGRGGQRGGGNQSWGGNQQTQGWAGNNQQQEQDYGGNQQQNWNKNQQQNNWGGGNQQKWGNQNQQEQQWNQQNQQSGWGGEEQNFNNRGRGPRGGNGGGGRGRGGPGRGGNFNNAPGGQFQGNEPQWQQQQQQIGPKVPPGVDFNNSQPPPPPPPEEKNPPPGATPPMSAQLEELSKAEKEFDDQFKSWADQFNTWKEQNKNHPDKDQYAEYETKMEKFRAQLLTRREQMQKKREIEERKLGLKASPNNPHLNAPPKQQVPQPLLSREEVVKHQAAKAFADNWAKEPPMEKPKGKSIQDTLLKMANCIVPKTNAGPMNVAPDGMEKQHKKGGIPGLDLGRDSFQLKEEVKPPGTDISPKKPPAALPTPPVKVEGKNQPYPVLGSQVKPSGPIRTPVKDEKFSPGGQNPGRKSSGPGLSGPGENFKNQQIIPGGGPPGGFGRFGKQSSFENYDEFGDESQDMAAMHERFAEDEDKKDFRGPGNFQGQNNEFRGPGGPHDNMRGRGPNGPNNNNFRGPGGPNNNFRGPGGPNENFEGPGGPHDNFRGPGGPNDSFEGRGGPNDNFRGRGGPNDNFRGRGGPNDNFRGRGGPNENFRGRGGPNENFRGRGGPNDNFRGPGGPNENFGGPGGPDDNYRGPGGPDDNYRGPGGPDDNFRGPGGPDDNFRGPGGPKNSFRGPGGPEKSPGGPSENFKGPGGPPDNFRGPGGPPENFRSPGGPPENLRGPGGPPDKFRGQSGPPDNFRGQGGPPENFRGPGDAPENARGDNEPSNNFRGPDNFRGPGSCPSEDFRGPDPKNQLTPIEQAGTIPNDFNPWIDLGSDDELPPELCDRGAPDFRGRGGSPMDRGMNMNWQDGPGYNNDDRRPPFRDDFDRGPMDRGRMPFNNFDERDMGRPMNDRDNMRGPPFHPDDRFGDFRDDRGFGPHDRGGPGPGPGPGGWNQEREWMMRQQRARQEWDKEDEYKAKTVIEYDHQPLNVITPALTPANVNPACKKKVIFKEPGKITDYSHSSEAEPTVHTPDPFDYDRTKYVKWDEEERKRKERERDRDMWMQEDRRFQRQQDFDRNSDRNNVRNQERNMDRNQERIMDRNQDRNIDRNQDRNVDRNQDRNLDRNPRNREEVRGRDRDDFRDRERDFRDRERHNPRDRERDRERPDSRNQDDSRDSRPQRSPSPRSGPSHSRGRGNREMPEKRPQDSSQPHRDNPPNRNQQQPRQQVPQPGNKLFNIPAEADTTQIEDLLCLPGRVQRPSKFAIFMRGPSGSGKSFAAKLIKDKEVENGGNAPRILSLDDYFMAEVEKEEQDPETGRRVKSKVMQYEYEVEMEEPYRASLIKAFKKTVDEGFFPIIIVDCVHDKVAHFEEMWRFAQGKGIKSFVVEMEADAQKCANQTEHGRSLQDIEKSIKSWEPAHSGITRLDITSLLQKASINEVEMEDLTDEDDETGEEAPFSALVDLPTSKWDKLDTEDKLAKLDGIKKSNKSKESLTMDDWLGLEELNDAPLEPGKKRVRWADLVERKEQEKMRAIGFVVGQTDWNRMMDPTFGGGALTRTKYI